MPFLTIAHIPNRNPICHGWDYKGIVDFLPIKHVDYPDGIAEDVDAADGGVASIHHCLGVVLPIEFGVNVDLKVLDGFLGNVHVLRAMDQVSVLYSWYRMTNQVWASVAMGKCHEFTFFGIGSQAISM